MGRGPEVGHCLVCGQRVVYGSRRLRKGPEGGIRCYEHLDTPVPDHVDPEALIPVEGTDYFWAEKRTYRMVYQAEATTTWVGHADDSPHNSELEPDTRPQVVDTLHKEVASRTRFKAIPATDPPEEFDIRRWRKVKRAELGLACSKPGDLPRPEQTLEAFARV